MPEEPVPSHPSLEGREILLCVTGGIACYKAADLTSRLVQAGAGVTVAMTGAARRFVTPLTFQTLSGRRVHTSLWQATDDYSAQHVALADRAELVIVAPATADILAKMACGIGDDLVSTLLLSAAGACPILLAPAMNARMWQSPATQASVARLRQWGAHLVGPVEGRLACGATGAGRMAEPADILHCAAAILEARPPRTSQ